MADPDTTLRMNTCPALDDAPPVVVARTVATRKPTIMGLPQPPVNFAALAFDAIPTQPALELELAYHRSLAAGAPPPPMVPLCAETLSHESTTQWPRTGHEPTVVLPTTVEVEVEVEVEAPMTSADWAVRFRPISVRPAPLPAPRRMWPLFVAAALSGGVLGAAVWMGVHVLTGGSL